MVKQIEVGAALEEENANLPYVRVESINTTKKSLTAQVTVDVQAKSGAITRKTIKIKPGDKLWEKTKRNDYEGLEVAEINFKPGMCVSLTMLRSHWVRKPGRNGCDLGSANPVHGRATFPETETHSRFGLQRQGSITVLRR
ncbi:hypothetical protein HED50_18680 [Ochrobactrum oryzae]|nr:hypothetical protein [Brucella oryzae]